MCLRDDVETILRLDDELVVGLYIPSQKTTIQDEEFRSISDQLS